MSNINSSLSRYAASATPAVGGAAVALPAKASRLSATSYQVFPKTDQGSLQQRYIHNPNAAGSIWVAFGGVDPVANGEGSFEIAPGGSWQDADVSEVRVLFTAAAAAITAFER